MLARVFYLLRDPPAHRLHAAHDGTCQRGGDEFVQSLVSWLEIHLLHLIGSVDPDFSGKHLSRAPWRMDRPPSVPARVCASPAEKARWLRLHAQENVPVKYTEKLAALLCITLATGKAWLLEEDLR